MKKVNVNLYSAVVAMLLHLISVTSLYAQVGINMTGNNPHSSAMLDVAADGATKAGLLIPRMTTAERNSISSPAQSLLIYNTTTKCFEFYENSTWQTLGCACTPPTAPTANAASGITQTAFTANWGTVSGATTYYLDVATDAGFSSFVSGYNNLNVGNVSQYNVSGLSCNTTYYYRVRAGNSCGTSGNSSTILVLTSFCTVTCGTQTFMGSNMNVGNMINGNSEQNNSQVEKYCYNDNNANCATYGGLYQWAESLQLPYTNNNNSVGNQTWTSCDPCNNNGIQGICPSGYHIPTDLEWSRFEHCVENTITPIGNTTLSDFQSPYTGWLGTNTYPIGAGAKLKATNPSWDGANLSGFTALPAGYRFNYGYYFYYKDTDVAFWTSTEYPTMLNTVAIDHHFTSNAWHIHKDQAYKIYGLSVRCIQN